MRNLQAYFSKTTDAAPLAVFRIFFGIMMFWGMCRFWYNGWIDKLYIQPKFFFSYYGFEWVKPIGEYTYILFFICAIAAIFVALGYKYRLAIIVFFLSFTYIELMDKTTYLNHYYFVSLLSFILIFLPANAYFSIDARKNSTVAAMYIPKFGVDAIKLLICLLYFYAGLAKLNSDWLIHAMPLKIWLPVNADIPILGAFLQKNWAHYAFSWAGMLYDLSIPFLLLYRRTRFIAFLLVVIFHVLTRILFPIGMFPFIMIVNALIFFDARLHHKIIKLISKLFRISLDYFDIQKERYFSPIYKKVIITVFAVFFVVQILFPWRYLLYPNELFWTEEGFRFSWRVMLMEKAGYAQFKIVDKATGKQFYVRNEEFLTPFQEKQMSFQPDFIIEYAHFLGNYYKSKGIEEPAVYVESYVTLNGRMSKPYIDPEVNLLEIEDSFKPKSFILDFEDEIKGL